jgi:hypothetical protein
MIWETLTPALLASENPESAGWWVKVCAVDKVAHRSKALRVYAFFAFVLASVDVGGVAGKSPGASESMWKDFIAQQATFQQMCYSRWCFEA